MLLYKKHKLLYKGFEKNAQTALYHHFGSPWSGPGVLGEATQGQGGKYSQFKSNYPDYTTIAFVRNPWDRILS
ncbi:unnamed protein product, partial [marine sediment metagenome]